MRLRDREGDRVPARGAVRNDVCFIRGLHGSGVVRRPDRDLVVSALVGLPVEAPQPPGVVVVRRTELSGLPWAVIDSDLDGLDPAMLRPGHSAEPRRAARN